MKKEIKTISLEEILEKDPEMRAEIDKETKAEQGEIKKALEAGDKFVYVKDDEDYVCRKLKSKVKENETIITRKEFEKSSGIEYYKKTYGRGGARPNAGRKKQYKNKVKETYEIEKTEADKLKSYAKEHGISKNKAITEAINKLVS